MNTKISDEQYEALVKEFSRDKDMKKQANMIFPKKEKKDKPKPKEQVSAEVKPEPRQSFTPLGKIDLDSLNGKKKAQEKPAAEPAKEETPAPKVATAEKPQAGNSTSGMNPVKEEARKEEVKVAEVKPEPKVEVRPEPKPEPVAEVKPETPKTPETTVIPETAEKPEPEKAPEVYKLKTEQKAVLISMSWVRLTSTR